MVQRNLDYYLQRSVQPKPSSLPSPCAPSFLDLPYQIRYRIYLLVGLVRFCPINFNQEGPRARYYLSEDHQSSDYACFFESRRFMGRLYERDCRPACHCQPLPFALLYTSRAISKEVSHILYSENAFTIGRSDSWGLKPLRNLNVSALSCLRVLTVRLNNCECLYEGEFRSLRSIQGPEIQGLFSCHPLCKHDGAHDQPLRSRARQHAAILQEWQDTVGRLAAHCRLESLRLDLVCDTQDMESAHHVVNRLSPIRNLGACSIRLSQRPNWQHSALARQTACRLMDRLPEPIPENQPKTYDLPPEILSHILEYSELVAPFDLEWRPDRGLVPFDCCTKCTATLDCLSIFLVGRQVHDIAKTIFYQRNRFIILPEGGRLDDLGSCRAAFPALTALFTRLPPNTAPLLRSIGLVVAPAKAAQGAAYARLLTEMGNVVRLLSTACDTRKLNLALFMGHAREMGHGSESEAILRSSYRNLVKPFGEIRDLHDLFIYIQWPNYAPADGTARYSSELEKEILGPGYDSEARGKWTHLPRLWYNGMSREGPAFAADGRRVWPRPYTEDAYGPPAPPPYTYV